VDSIDVGVDAYNPLEAKAGMNVVDLRAAYGHSIGFCGKGDIQVWERGVYLLDPTRRTTDDDFRQKLSSGIYENNALVARFVLC
jgi:hypothetical protein